MIYRGRYAGFYLYQLTRQDLMLQGTATAGYSDGNVLIYANRDDIQLGTQIARADDLAAAHEYLDHSGEIAFEHARELGQRADSLEQQAFSLEDEVARLTHDIEQRDELLRDISDSLAIQRDHNEFLTTQLRSARERLSADELTREELMSDLQNVSEETHNIEVALEETLIEKDELEQELAAAITNFIELNLQNDEMRRRLDELNAHSLERAAAAAPHSPVPATAPRTTTVVYDTSGAEPITAPLYSVAPVSSPDSAGQAAAAFPQRACATYASAPASYAPAPAGNIGPPAAFYQPAPPPVPTQMLAPLVQSGPQTITMSSGKQIHIYHEFPAPNSRSVRARLSLTSRAILRGAIALLIVLALALLASVISTAQINQISLGEALDVLLKGFGLP
jgi:regulator of replication initiation timing